MISKTLLYTYGFILLSVIDTMVMQVFFGKTFDEAYMHAGLTNVILLGCLILAQVTKTAHTTDGAQEIERLRAIIKSLEWNGGFGGHCPSCNMFDDEGHDVTCKVFTPDGEIK